MSLIHRFARLGAARRGARTGGEHSRSRSAIGRALRVESLEDRRLLAVTVTTLVDENDGVDVGGTSLRDAIAAAPAGETIEFAPALTNAGPATILLTRGELFIRKDLTINGPGAALLTVDASGNDPTPNVNEGNGSRVFHIDDAANSLKKVVINGLRVTGGDASGPGGAILARENLTLVSCVITGNATFTNSQLGGGGIYSAANSITANSLMLVDCSITNNVAVRDEGGGVRKQRGTLIMEGCTVSGNTSTVLGGGLSAADASVNIQIRSSTFTSNSATGYYGGGIFVYSGVLTLTDSTLSGNSAPYGAGLYLTTTSQGTVVRSTINNNTASVDGGGVHVDSSQLTIIGSTLSTNSARGFGGGAAMPNGTLILRHSTVTANRANTDNVGGEQGGGLITGTGVVTLDHTIVAGNLRGTSIRSDAIGPTSARFSLIGDNTGATITDNGGNLIGTGAFPVNPLLGPLAENGGPTRTHALQPGSQAIDAGDPAALAGAGSVPTSDQRGVPFIRIYNGGGDLSARIDIGAYEVQAPGIAADFDDDQDVDGADFLAWQRGLGAAGPLATKNLGNADGDDDVDGVDLAAWEAAFGAVEEVVAAAAAEQLDVGRTPVDQNPSLKGRLRAAPRPEIVDAAMALEQLLDASAPRRNSRLRFLRSR
jgi:hypothetical protein